jgi:hypothetical protein
MKDIHVSEDKSYTLNEVIDAVKQTLDAVSEQSVQNKLRYSSTDLYWLLHDMLRYVNRNVPGEFVLYQTKKGVYRVRYAAEDSARRSSSRKLKSEVNRTASYLEELTGRRPSWGEEEEQ